MYAKIQITGLLQVETGYILGEMVHLLRLEQLILR